MLDGQYKTLHLIASSSEAFRLWDITLRKLYAIRQELMTGLGNEEIRQAVWVRQCWKSTGEQNDQRLSFDQVEKLCRRLNINSSQEDLMRLFSVGYPDFFKFLRCLMTSLMLGLECRLAKSSVPRLRQLSDVREASQSSSRDRSALQEIMFNE